MATALNYPRGIRHYTRSVAFTRAGGYQNAAKELEMVNLHGAILIESDKAVAAEEVYRNDLIIYPENGWSLFGLKIVLKMQGKDAEAVKVETSLTEAWAWADIPLTSSCF